MTHQGLVFSIIVIALTNPLDRNHGHLESQKVPAATATFPQQKTES